MAFDSGFSNGFSGGFGPSDTLTRHEKEMRKMYFSQVLNQPGGVLQENFHVLGLSLDEMEDKLSELLVDIFPDTTIYSLSDYERVYNVEPEGNETERKNAVITAMRARGGLSKSYFEALGNKMGEGVFSIEITEGTDPLGFLIHDRSPLTSPKGPGTLISDVEQTPIADVNSGFNCYYLTCYVTTISGPVLAERTKLEQLLNRLKPAHTTFYFEYIGLP